MQQCLACALLLLLPGLPRRLPLHVLEPAAQVSDVLHIRRARLARVCDRVEGRSGPGWGAEAAVPSSVWLRPKQQQEAPRTCDPALADEAVDAAAVCQLDGADAQRRRHLRS